MIVSRKLAFTENACATAVKILGVICGSFYHFCFLMVGFVSREPMK